MYESSPENPRGYSMSLPNLLPSTDDDRFQHNDSTTYNFLDTLSWDSLTFMCSHEHDQAFHKENFVYALGQPLDKVYTFNNVLPLEDPNLCCPDSPPGIQTPHTSTPKRKKLSEVITEKIQNMFKR